MRRSTATRRCPTTKSVTTAGLPSAAEPGARLLPEDLTSRLLTVLAAPPLPSPRPHEHNQTPHSRSEDGMTRGEGAGVSVPRRLRAPVRSLDILSRPVVASLPPRVPRGSSPRLGRRLAGSYPPVLASSRGPFPTSYLVVLDQSAAGPEAGWRALPDRGTANYLERRLWTVESAAASSARRNSGRWLDQSQTVTAEKKQDRQHERSAVSPSGGSA